MLKKDQKIEIMKSIRSFSLHKIAREIQSKLNEQFPSERMLREVLDCLMQQDQLLLSLAKYHHITFVNLYVKCGSGKDKYIRFQLDWHKHCSIFLLPKESSIDCIFPSDTDNDDDTKSMCTLNAKEIKEIKDIRHLWSCFCDSYPTEQQMNCKKIMISFSSAVHDILLRQLHASNGQLTETVCKTASSSSDGDDVYIRFGGASICSMLHLRYKDIKKCPEGKRDAVSQEIKILQNINTKDKADLPQYLKYRDRGYMYTPHRIFIPFFRCVDNCVREIVNQSGFQEHGDDLIKVY